MNQELEQLKNQLRDSEEIIYAATTGRGRKKKAHILKKEGESLCGRLGKKYRRLDSKTVEKFYDKCQFCEKRKAVN